MTALYRITDRIPILPSTLLTLICVGIILFSTHPVNSSDGCTLALVRASRTADGRMIIWKNRDVSNRNEVARLFTGPTYRFIGIGYGDQLTEVWGGVNSAGFAVANSNAWNFESFITPDDDGTIQTLALGTCNTIAQFRTILNNTNFYVHAPDTGRNTPSDFFVFDSSGAMSIFEARRHSWVEYTLTSSTPNGYFVRANYGYSGDTLHNPLGFYRNNRARRCYYNSILAGQLTLDSVFHIMRDIAPDGWSPNAFPLPYNGNFSGFPYAYVSMNGSICRRNTSAGLVIQGGKRLPDGSWAPPLVWFFLGSPLTTIGVPVWVNQTSISSYLTGSSAPVCTEAYNIYNTIDSTNSSIDSRFLVNGSGGFLQYLYQKEAIVRQRTAPYMNVAITASNATLVSDSLAKFVFEALRDYSPPLNPVNFRFDTETHCLYWDPVTKDFRNRDLPLNANIQYQIEYAQPTSAPYSLNFIPIATTSANWFSVNNDRGLRYVYRIKAISN